VITAAVTKAVAPNCDASVWAPALAAAASEFEINTAARAAHWLAQVAHESGGLAKTVENLNYSPDGLMATFGRTRISREQADHLGRTKAHPADQTGIANVVYGGAWGRKNLGNVQDGDGGRFRGRGPLQITGRANFAKMGDALGLDLLTHPELLSRPDAGARSAGAFWKDRGLNALADADDIEAITRRINGGLTGLDRRQYLLGIARAALAEPVT
jgi:putative chitinase